ncbi:MAG TPA: large conductance mechanosensitive channel protein MscL [Bellilinea sp.]|nr:large conductance mechanosensitive channel protein MscL [Bellilinea sp.]
MLKEFKTFIMRGNVMDLAIAVIIGAAFGAIINSLVKDIIMPPIGLALGKVDFANLYVALDGNTYESLAKAQEIGAPTLNYGLFINTIINFLIVGFVIFLIVKAINKMQKPVVAAVTTKECVFCATEIPLTAKRCPHCTSELP